MKVTCQKCLHSWNARFKFERVSCPNCHDKDWRNEPSDERIKAIDALIPAATIEAHKKVRKLGKYSETRPGIDDTTRSHDFQTMYYHRAMNRMAREAGLR